MLLFNCLLNNIIMSFHKHYNVGIKSLRTLIIVSISYRLTIDKTSLKCRLAIDKMSFKISEASFGPRLNVEKASFDFQPVYLCPFSLDMKGIRCSVSCHLNVISYLTLSINVLARITLCCTTND